MAKRRGNCYVTCEALYHLLGGKKAGWVPMVMHHEGDTHWWLEKRIPAPNPAYGMMADGSISIISLLDVVRLDPTASQFKTMPDYSKGRACGFLTKKPSKRAKAMMERMIWQE